MFGKSSGKSSSRSTPKTPTPSRLEKRKEQSLLQTGVRLQGELQVDGDLRVEGAVTGDLRVKGTLLVGAKATVEGELSGRDVVIHGRVAGTIQADQQVRLAHGARVSGDLFCESLIIEEGVLFEGRSHMGESARRPAHATHTAQIAHPQANAGPTGIPGSPAGVKPATGGGLPQGPRDKSAYQTANTGPNRRP